MTSRIAVLACAAVLVTASACTSARTTSGEGSPISSAGVTSPGSDTATGAATSTTDTPTVQPTASTPVSSAAASKPATASVNTCAFSQLGMRALRGSGAQQREYAAIMFTNKGTAACTIYGFPGVSLRYQGALLGQPATRDTTAAATAIHFAPGAVVQADITDDSSCQAPLSDTVRVYPPDSTQYVDLPLQLRGCALTVKPVAGS